MRNCGSNLSVRFPPVSDPGIGALTPDYRSPDKWKLRSKAKFYCFLFHKSGAFDEELGVFVPTPSSPSPFPICAVPFRAAPVQKARNAVQRFLSYPPKWSQCDDELN